MISILIVDDHAVVRAGLLALLDGEPGFTVAGECGDGDTAVRLAQRLRPDVVLMDVRLGAGPGGDGIDTTRRILTAVPGTGIVVLTSYGSQDAVMRAIEAGARGYVLKAGEPEELFRAVRTVAAGGMTLAPGAAERLISRVSDPEPLLSDRETQVVRLLARGHNNRDIAAALFLSEATIKTHLVRIYRKLGTGNRVSTVAEATRRGLIEPG
ncbi:response regulator transcription factor [Actinoplanes sichuanensis]|uniref:Response regulator n=1 Tax=Actinoplanes sichuanensis TaxID=512349 RepID=A0ABW4A7J7_9ACTN|nr:response regulator transcription factor [Actinoplanes sichuanensis]BEL07879.1 response regulator transcription factor [Actinoplanes sichuanensis]